MKTFGFVLLAALLAVGIWERTTIAALRTEKAGLHDQQSAAQALMDENVALTKRLDETPSSALAVDKAELLRLRNEVRRLRSTPTDPARLLAENEKLAADLKSGNIRLPRLADQAGYVARETWANVGTATPEAALQTVLMAIRDGNLDLLVQTLSESDAAKMRSHLEQDPVGSRKEFALETQSHFPATGYVISQSEEIEGGKIRLKVRFTLQGAPVEMEFQREGAGWRLSKGF